MKNLAAFTSVLAVQETPAVIPNELVDQAIKIVVGILTVVITNWLSSLLKKKKEAE